MNISNDVCRKLLFACMPGGVSSPVRSGKCVGGGLPVMCRGEGPYLVDVEGNRYIDCCLSWGALIHGHAHPYIVAEVQKAVLDGTTFGTSTPYEFFLAENIQKEMPSLEKIRFVSTGTEATMSAVRLARGYTRRSNVVMFTGQYHGHVDQFLTGGLFSGIPESFSSHTLLTPYNDEKRLRSLFEEKGESIAAVIIEPVAANMGVVPPVLEFLESVREITAQYNSLLIFDEVVTCFRVGRGGAQKLYNIVPDLTCLGKIIGGGFPAAAFGGKKEIMDLLAPLGPVYQAGTLSGNPVAMRAGLASLQLALEPCFYEKLEEKMNRLFVPIEKCIKEKKIKACVQRVGSMITLFFGVDHVNNAYDAASVDKEMFQKFFWHMLRRGIYIPPAHSEAWFLSSVHEEKHLAHIERSVLEFMRF